jgi:hypothetical protein
MKKATIGIFLFGAMVFTKAFLIEESNGDSNLISRDHSFATSFQESEILRADFSFQTAEPRAMLLAANFVLPSSGIFESNTQFKSSYEKEEVIVDTDFLADHSVNIEVEEAVIPMDDVSYTGYGMWNSNTENIRSKEDRDGLIPLDRTNTISDNISKLFPRVP